MFAVPVAAALAAVLCLRRLPPRPWRRSPLRVTGVSRSRPSAPISSRAPAAASDQAQIDDGLKALIETGLFQDVRINQAGGRLVVTVVENRRDRAHRLRGQQEGQGRAAFG